MIYQIKTMEKTKTPTQKEMILSHLRTFGSIDPLTAFKEYGCLTNLHARITELRRAGVAIRTDYLTGKSAITGRTWRVAKYVYCGE